MRLNSTVQPIYFPEPDQKTVLRMGLQNLGLSNWLLVDEDFSVFHQHKLQQKAERGAAVSQETKGTESAIEEFNDYLLTYLLSHKSDQYIKEKDVLKHVQSGIELDISASTLWQASLWVQDDVCLLLPQNDVFVLAAASLCSPTDWRLEDKIGHTVEWIHEPVPNYAHTLNDRVNLLLAKLKPENPVSRFNWSIQQGNELYWQTTGDEQAENLEHYWRVERQSLIKLPDSGAIVFAIRIFLHSFGVMEAAMQEDDSNELGFRQSLLNIIENLPESTRRYKGLDEKLFERLQRE